MWPQYSRGPGPLDSGSSPERRAGWPTDRPIVKTMNETGGGSATTGRGLQARDISVRLGDNQILDSASLDARPGELLGLLGPNGAGKSTLLRVMAGLLKPDAGEVRFDGALLGHDGGGRTGEADSVHAAARRTTPVHGAGDRPDGQVSAPRTVRTGRGRGPRDRAGGDGTHGHRRLRGTATRHAVRGRKAARFTGAHARATGSGAAARRTGRQSRSEAPAVDNGRPSGGDTTSGRSR